MLAPKIVFLVIATTSVLLLITGFGKTRMDCLAFLWTSYLFTCVVISASTATHTLGLKGAWKKVDKGLKTQLKDITISFKSYFIYEADQKMDPEYVRPQNADSDPDDDTPKPREVADYREPNITTALQLVDYFHQTYYERAGHKSSPISPRAVALSLIAIAARGACFYYLLSGRFDKNVRIPDVELSCAAFSLQGYLLLYYLLLLVQEFRDDRARWKMFEVCCNGFDDPDHPAVKTQTVDYFALNRKEHVRAWYLYRQYLRDFKGGYDYMRLQVVAGLTLSYVVLAGMAFAGALVIVSPCGLH